MSLIKEYFSLLGKGIKNYDKIAEGVINSITDKHLTEGEKQVIAIRSKACADCPFNSENAKTSAEFKELMGHNYKSSRTEPHCAICGCVLKLKIASLSSNCGLEIYNSNNPNNKQKLKWRAYVK